MNDDEILRRAEEIRNRRNEENLILKRAEEIANKRKLNKKTEILKMCEHNKNFIQTQSWTKTQPCTCCYPKNQIWLKLHKYQKDLKQQIDSNDTSLDIPFENPRIKIRIEPAHLFGNCSAKTPRQVLLHVFTKIELEKMKYEHCTEKMSNEEYVKLMSQF